MYGCLSTIGNNIRSQLQSKKNWGVVAIINTPRSSLSDYGGEQQRVRGPSRRKDTMKTPTKKQLIEHIKKTHKNIVSLQLNMAKIGLETTANYGTIRMLEETRTFSESCLKLGKELLEE